MYELHLCVSVFVLLSLPAADRSIFLNFVGPYSLLAPPNHTLSFFWHRFWFIIYLHTSAAVDILIPAPTHRRRRYASERLAN